MCLRVLCARRGRSARRWWRCRPSSHAPSNARAMLHCRRMQAVPYSMTTPWHMGCLRRWWRCGPSSHTLCSMQHDMQGSRQMRQAASPPPPLVLEEVDASGAAHFVHLNTSWSGSLQTGQLEYSRPPADARSRVRVMCCWVGGPP